MSQYFRMQIPHPDDLGTTRIRMEKTHMQKLGIHEGDIVKMIGGRTTYAFCITLDDDHYNPNEKNFVCLDEVSKNVPMIRVSDLTYSNLHNFHIGNLVELQKSNAVKASKVLVKPIYPIEPNEKENFNLNWLYEQVIVSKGDRIIGRHDPKKTLGFFVIDASPPSDAWIVDKNTPVELSDKIPENFIGMITRGGNLNSVIPVVQKIKGNDFEATISAIEVYDNCMKIIMYVKDSIVHQEDQTSGLCTPTIRMWDDLGNHYMFNRYGARSGGGQFGDSLWGGANKHDNFSEISLIVIPSLDKKAQELNISIEQLLWDIRKHPPHNPVPVKKGLPIVMTPGARVDEKCAIHGGPWNFKINIKEK
ncbi:MAG: hypothetical protein LV477_00265 [Candidatus Nitrosotalea sp.]|nr:hypothetical protein [Candidatus Nitrosotalea sp.]